MGSARERTKRSSNYFCKVSLSGSKDLDSNATIRSKQFSLSFLPKTQASEYKNNLCNCQTCCHKSTNPQEHSPSQLQTFFCYSPHRTGGLNSRDPAAPWSQKNSNNHEIFAFSKTKITQCSKSLRLNK